MYGSKILDYERILRVATDNYIKNQRAHFQAVLDELEYIMAEAG